MPWTPEYQSLLDTYAGTFGLPGLGGAEARAWTRQLAEQFAWSFPKEGWGTKQADNTRPQSTDVICTRVPFVGYDVILQQGTPEQKLANNPEGIPLAGQVFIAVSPVNHLSGAPPVPVTPPSDGPMYPYPDEPTAGRAYQDRVHDTYEEKGRDFPDPADPDAFRHFMRYGYSSSHMPEPEAADKHIAELRAELGLPPK